ncbi:hypothetical protein BGZ80_007717 [Entomortierella chlamydospora]|uniref:SCP domain-containing protein n=1 Tax=Entomortierella chlamydospora TaxID=101097 RepID=A0A9P6T4N9_9FUNG|nr:hypothetical protein BGZ80_007717 [Entomortierella chlamydospora]
MVKFTTLLLASVAVLAASTNAQDLLEPRTFTPEQANVITLPHNQTLERRASDGLTAKERKDILAVHNKYRARHQAPALTWNSKIATFGNNWIQACEFKHSGGPHGENLAAGYSNFKAAVKAWYDEVKYYNYGRPGFSSQTGHYTQVVWKSTSSVGCAKKKCPNYYIYICEYDSPGNIVTSDGSYFKKNVLPTVKSK